MERTVSVSLYLAAFLISVAIFVAGIFIGSVIDRSNLAAISDEVKLVSNRVASMQLAFMVDENSTSFCPVHVSELRSVDADIEHVGYKLTYLEDEKQAYDPELKRQYFILEAESYLLSKRVKQLCGDDSTLLINFYSNKRCTGCKEQGYAVLEARDSLVVNNNHSVRLFSFDGDLDSAVVDALKAQYGVSSYPTLVINEVAYPGYQSADTIKRIIESTPKNNQTYGGG